MQTIALIILLILSIFIQGHLKMPFHPDLLLAFIVAVSVKRSDMEAVSYSFVLGFLEDILYSVGFINTLVKTIIGSVIPFAKKFFVLDPRALCFFFAIAATFLSVFMANFFMGIFYSSEIGVPWVQVIISSVINAILASLFYIILDLFVQDEG